jgi:hypothetical protein
MTWFSRADARRQCALAEISNSAFETAQLGSQPYKGKPNMINVNARLQALFNAHGIETIPLEQRFLLVTKQLAIVHSGVSSQEFTNGVSSRLDVSVTVKDRTIIECFGDVGTTTETALANNLQNFAHNSLHILIGALQGVDKDEQFDVEQWEVNGQT